MLGQVNEPCIVLAVSWQDFNLKSMLKASLCLVIMYYLWFSSGIPKTPGWFHFGLAEVYLFQTHTNLLDCLVIDFNVGMMVKIYAIQFSKNFPFKLVYDFRLIGLNSLLT